MITVAGGLRCARSISIGDVGQRARDGLLIRPRAPAHGDGRSFAGDRPCDMISRAISRIAAIPMNMTSVSDCPTLLQSMAADIVAGDESHQLV